MKSATIAAMLVLILGSLMLTGFQCGSAELTSAKLYFQRGDYANAEKSLMKEVAKNPANAEAWYLLGQTRYQMNNFEGMLEPFDKSLGVSKEFETNIIAARKAGWQQTLNAAVGYFNKSLTIAKDPNGSKDSIAMLRASAMEEYKLALKINPDSAITYQNMAVAQMADGKYEDEIVTLNEAIKRKPSSPLYQSLVNAYLSIASNADAKNDKAGLTAAYNGALDALASARKLEPDNADLLATAIDIYVRLGKAPDAKPLIAEAIQKDPGNKVYQYNYGVLLMQTDSLEAAIPYFEKALVTDPNYEVALQNLAVAHMKLGDEMKKASTGKDSKPFIEHFKKAAGYFENLTTLKPTDANYWDYLASAYANSNQIKKAQEALKKADEVRKK